MYESHFALRQRPVPAVPDSTTYFPAAAHEQALTSLVRGISSTETSLHLATYRLS